MRYRFRDLAIGRLTGLHVLLDHRADPHAGLLELFLTTLDLADAFFSHLGAATFALDVGIKLRVDLVEDRQIIAELGDDAGDRMFDLAEGAVRRTVAVIAPGHPGARQVIEQRARRMLAIVEEFAVEHRGLEQRNLQAAQQRLHRLGQILITEDEVEQHLHDVEHILIGTPQAATRIALGPQVQGAAQAGHQLDLHVLHLAHIGGRGAQRLELYRAEGYQQVIGADFRQVAGHRALVERPAQPQATAGLATRGQQLRQQRQGFSTRLGGRRLFGLHRRQGRFGLRVARALHRRRHRIATHLLHNLRQNAGTHQDIVDLVVQTADIGHHVAIEQLVDQQLDRRFAAPQVQRLGKPGSQHLGADGVVGDRDFVAPEHFAEAHVHGVQLAVETILRLGNHRGDRQILFQVVLINQAQLVFCRLGSGKSRPGSKVGPEIVKALHAAVDKAFFNRLALLAQLAHGLEVAGLQGIAGGFIRQLIQIVIEMLEQVLQQARQGFAQALAHGLDHRAQLGIRQAPARAVNRLFERNHIILGHCLLACAGWRPLTAVSTQLWFYLFLTLCVVTAVECDNNHNPPCRAFAGT